VRPTRLVPLAFSALTTSQPGGAQRPLLQGEILVAGQLQTFLNLDSDTDA
jgi:hypothetical protein